MVMAQALDSTGTNNPTCLVKQWRTCVIPQSAHKGLKFGGDSTGIILDCRQDTLCAQEVNINIVGKHKQLHMLAAGLASVRHDT